MKQISIKNVLAAIIFVCILVACKKDMPEFTVLDGIKDIDGNTYSVVKIGNQIWMAENLKTTKLNDSTDIRLVSNDQTWVNTTVAAYCWYNNDEASNKDVYGALYNWYAVGTGKLCPSGWHVPTHTEWTILVDYLGGSHQAGAKLKAKELWKSPNSGASNSSGFSALPGGYRYSHWGSFEGLTVEGKWWSGTSTEIAASFRNLYYDEWSIYNTLAIKDYGMSVRCIKD